MADLIELAKQQADEISRAGHNGWGNTMAALVEALEAAREDASCMHRFAGMLLGGMNDIQDALGFTDEDKLCANGSAEIVAEIAELREDAERYRALRDALLDDESEAWEAFIQQPEPKNAADFDAA